MEYFTYNTWPYFRVYLKTVNMPKQRVFSACCAPFSLVIHKVFLRKNGFIRIDPNRSPQISHKIFCPGLCCQHDPGRLLFYTLFCSCGEYLTFWLGSMILNPLLWCRGLR